MIDCRMQIITTHKNADFDALASVFAAVGLYPEALPILPVSLNPNVKAFLSIHKDLFDSRTVADVDLRQVQRLIVVDTNKWGRLDRMSALRERPALDVMLWDHHMDAGDITAQWQCREKTGATVTLLMRRIKAEGISLTPIQATLFLAGIYEDTGNLTFPSTTAEDVYTAGFLLESGADLNILSSFLRPAYGEKQKDMLFTMLQTAQRRRVNGFSISINAQQTAEHVDGLAVVVAMYRQILNVDAAFGLFYDPKQARCMVIGRSSSDAFDVGAVLRSMGGGGHPAAGSALLKSAQPDAVKQWILELIGGNQQSSVRVTDLMSFPVFTVGPAASLEAVGALLRQKGCTGLPVVENDRLVGIISRRDLQRLNRKNQLSAPVKAFMKTDVKTVEPGASPMQAARLMVKHDIGRLPVVKDGAIIGILTRSDVMAYFYDLLPD